MHHASTMIDDPTLPEGGDGRFRELLDRRDRIQAWLARLDTETGVSADVAERVRADYLRQLQEITHRLADHLDELRARSAELDASVAQAEADSREVSLALEEAGLRYRIGEVEERAWDERRAELEPAVATAAARLQELRAEAEDLANVLAAIAEGLDGTETPPPLPVLQELDPAPDSVTDSVESAREEASPPDAAADGDDGRDPALHNEEDTEATRPAPGVKCVECGYTNDFGAAYCGVCGVTLS